MSTAGSTHAVGSPYRRRSSRSRLRRAAGLWALAGLGWAGAAAAQVRPFGGACVNASATPVLHVVSAGETLWYIARQVLGDGHRWSELRTVSGGLPDPKALQPGARLVLPGSFADRGSPGSAGDLRRCAASPERAPRAAPALRREATTPPREAAALHRGAAARSGEGATLPGEVAVLSGEALPVRESAAARARRWRGSAPPWPPEPVPAATPEPAPAPASDPAPEPAPVASSGGVDSPVALGIVVGGELVVTRLPRPADWWLVEVPADAELHVGARLRPRRSALHGGARLLVVCVQVGRALTRVISPGTDGLYPGATLRLEQVRPSRYPTAARAPPRDR